MTSITPAELDLDRACVRSSSGLLCDVHGRALWPSLALRCNGWAARQPEPDGLREALLDQLREWDDGGRVGTTDPEYAFVADFLERHALAAPPPSPEPLDDKHRALAYSFWVHYRCGYVDCETVEPHEHGGGPAMREMTSDEIAERDAASTEPSAES